MYWKFVQQEMDRLVKQILEYQKNNGVWEFCIECSSTMPDAFMIILLKSLQLNEEELVEKLVNSLLKKQEQNGAWKIYKDELEGNLSATIDAYFAILYSGYMEKSHPKMILAKRFIEQNGGLAKANTLTKVILAISDQYQWPHFIPTPIEAILIPQSFPINFYDFSGHARVHIAPMLILADTKFKLVNKQTPDLADLRKAIYLPENIRNTESDSILTFIKQGIQGLAGLPEQLHQLAVTKAKKYILDRIEPNGTLYNYFSATILMIYALLAVGYKKESKVIGNAVKGLMSFICNREKEIMVQNFTGTVWNTALISNVLQRAGLSSSIKSIKKANYFLLTQQQTRFGDWSIKSPNVVPGGWGFSGGNTLNPDIDDTTAALRALKDFIHKNKAFRSTWDRGVNWILGMQNNDGGWPAFESNTDLEVLKYLPIEGAKYVSIDPSTADLTGRTLEFLGNDVGLDISNVQVRRGVEWLKKNQQDDGSWYGRWGVTYIYGTWAAITGMKAAGVSNSDFHIQKGISWLEAIQNPDGGWGESCNSDTKQSYQPLGVSTPTQTAWALDALIAYHEYPTKQMELGLLTLMRIIRDKDKWPYQYPTGSGLPGSYYFNYHSYNYIWPLLTLSNYIRKYNK